MPRRGKHFTPPPPPGYVYASTPEEVERAAKRMVQWTLHHMPPLEQAALEAPDETERRRKAHARRILRDLRRMHVALHRYGARPPVVIPPEPPEWQVPE